jgi:hypothetical protein
MAMTTYDLTNAANGLAVELENQAAGLPATINGDAALATALERLAAALVGATGALTRAGRGSEWRPAKR